MQNTEIEFIRFDARDVISTSTLGEQPAWLSNGKADWASQKAVPWMPTSLREVR